MLQHFGFQFNYRTLMLDYNKPTPPLPPSCAALAERFATSYAQLQETGSVSPEDTVEAASINQLTINEYLPGQGIAPHTGACSPFQFCGCVREVDCKPRPSYQCSPDAAVHSLY